MSNTPFAERFAVDEPVLMMFRVFRVRHMLTLDKSATDGISRQPFTGDDFRATIHETLLPNNYIINFSSLFSPNVTLSRWKPSYFKKDDFQERGNNLIIESIYKCIFLFFSILLNYLNRPIVGLSSTVTEELKEKAAYESAFSQRMRA